MVETARVDSKGREGLKRVGRYSFAVSAVVIYLKPLAVNISSSFIQRLGSFSRLQGCTLCCVPSYLAARAQEDRKTCSMCSRCFPRNRGGFGHRGRVARSSRPCLPFFFLCVCFVYSDPLRDVRFKLR